ncbi:hypothetical protein DFH94DRAFT_197046 [Russula ochroleuca]|uniref:C2H2-type domain-containing protein n=1 Tax=Russula ochroleuca TaxID=152965 RepID=A0A9P5K008_9AGAM|nr:hypothetical protein DFH94DRAFT_197046 [Russula ochroleuca]
MGTRDIRSARFCFSRNSHGWHRGTYPFMHPSLSTLYGGYTDPWKQGGFAHPHDPQITEKAYPTSSIHGIDGGPTPHFEGLFFQSTFPGPAGWRKSPERPYSCDICSKRFSQRQGVSRHRRKAHNNPHSCLVLRCEFNGLALTCIGPTLRIGILMSIPTRF